MKPRDIFGLAVRLLGLFFLYLGLRAIPPMLDFWAIETADKSEIINAILPMIFNLVVAWWLIGGGLLIHRAYPEASRIPTHSHAPREGTAPVSKPIQPRGTTDTDRAEKRLASLVEKTKDSHEA